ncbi:hypothetical protein GCM10009416_48140 [Craurococcus roseus]|uniref:Methyltransferase domain-containing protein n=1 Tax=Craurococcus roseus TaxID=77585 RepID=A0ABN1G678_9PROT
MAEALFTPKAAEGYDGLFRDVSRRFVPTLLRLAGVAPAQRVLDVATGTGIAAEAAAEAVGPSGRVVAADVSPAMLEKARARLGAAAGVSFALEDGQALSMPDGEFDAVLCHLGLMFFPDPAKGLAEFRRVLRPGGRVAVSVNAPARSFLTPVFAAIAARLRSEGGVSQRLLRSDLDPDRLRELLGGAGFGDLAVTAETHRFVLPSFEAYFAGIEAGGGGVGQDYARLSEGDRRAVREEVQQRLGGTDGPVALDVELWFGSGHR